MRLVLHVCDKVLFVFTAVTFTVFTNIRIFLSLPYVNDDDDDDVLTARLGWSDIFYCESDGNSLLVKSVPTVSNSVT